MGGLTNDEQHRLNQCYVELKSALDGLAMIENKDIALQMVQRKLGAIEDTLHQYVGPTRKEEE